VREREEEMKREREKEGKKYRKKERKIRTIFTQIL
jgi:hypothetical protein